MVYRSGSTYAIVITFKTMSKSLKLDVNLGVLSSVQRFPFLAKVPRQTVEATPQSAAVNMAPFVLGNPMTS